MREFGRILAGMGGALACAALAGTALLAQDAPAQIVLSQPASADSAPAEIATADFATRSAIQGAELSPDGAKLAVWTVENGNNVISAIDTRTQRLLARTDVGGADFEFTLDWFDWAGNDKILISVDLPGKYRGSDFRFTRMMAWDLTSDAAFPVGLKRMTLVGDNVIHTAEDGSYILLQARKHLGDWPEVYRIDLTPDAEPERVQKSERDVSTWVADDAGVVRLGYGYIGWTKRRLRLRYRPDGQSKFETIAKLSEDDERARYWEVERVISGSDRGYILHEGEQGRMALRAVDYATGEVGETIYENPDWDLTSALLDRSGEPLAAYYTDDRDRIVWLREKERKLQARLEAALPGKEVRIIQRAHEDAMFLVSSSGASDPGALYLFDPAAKELTLVSEYRPAIDERLLAEPKEIIYTARDGTDIRAVLTLPKGREARALPLIVMPHGGPYGVRDRLEYEDRTQMLANRGYAVIQPNFRGSGGYGEAFAEAGYGQIGRAMQDDLDDAMDWAVGEGIADPARVCMVGSSYGGYAALYSVLRNPERYRCAASFAGVIDWDRQLTYDRRYLTRKASRSWSDRVRGDENDFDMDSVSVYELAERLARPVLIAHGKQDDNVPFEQYELFMRATRKSTLVTPLVFEEEGHGLGEEANERAWYDALLAFLAEHNPPD